MARQRDNKESYDYYKVSYRQNARNFREKHVGINFPPMLSERDWKRTHGADGFTNREIVWGQFHEYTREQVGTMYKALKAEGIKANKFQLSQKNLTGEMWSAFKEHYHKNRASGMTAKEAKSNVSHVFFGSM